MKKFGAKNIAALTMALALVTVGAVYAQWEYSGTAAGQDGGLSFHVENANTTGINGTYAIDTSGGTKSYIYNVDQYSVAYATSNTDYAAKKVGSGYTSSPYNLTTPDNHAAALCVGDGAYFTVRFTPSNAASTAITNYGVQTTITLTLGSVGYYYYDSGNWTYSTTNAGSYTAMFSLATTTITLLPTNQSAQSAYEYVLNADSDGSFYYTFGEDALLSLVNLEYMEVPTSTVWTAFNTACGSTSITVDVLEVV